MSSLFQRLIRFRGRSKTQTGYTAKCSQRRTTPTWTRKPFGSSSEQRLAGHVRRKPRRYGERDSLPAATARSQAVKARQVVGARKLGCAVEGAARVVDGSRPSSRRGSHRTAQVPQAATTPDINELWVGAENSPHDPLPRDKLITLSACARTGSNVVDAGLVTEKPNHEKKRETSKIPPPFPK